MTLLGTRERFGRGKALALLGGVLLTCAAVAIVPQIWSYQLTRQIDEQTATASRLEAQALKLSTSKQRLAALSDPTIARSMLLAGSTAGLNGADLQKRITGIAKRAGIRPQSLRVADPQPWQEGLRNISLEIGMRATLDQVQAFLYDVETERPLMFVDAMTIARPEAVAAGDGAGPLDVTLTVRGVALAGPVR